MLGKRKRRASLEKDTASTDQSPSADNYHALLRQHFERTYEPLVTAETNAASPNTDDDAASDESDAWDGLSDFDGSSEALKETEPYVVEIIDHSGASRPNDNVDDSRKLRKAFMSSKLPSESTIQALRKVKPATKDENPTSEAALVKNDLALQRLLRESKLLSSTSSAGTDMSLQLSGKQRHKALDTHLQALGAKTSIQTQKNMPRAHRVGITKKATQKEEARRAEAREAGVVLEKVKRIGSDTKRRERGVGAPGVGKFRSGTLSLSARDVRAIQGPSARTKGKKKGRR